MDRNPLYAPVALGQVSMTAQLAEALCPPTRPPRALEMLLRHYFLHQAKTLNLADPAYQAVLRGHGPALAHMLPSLTAQAWDDLLIVACMTGQEDAVQVLLTSGMNPTATDALGHTALHWACIVDNTAIQTRLRQAGWATDCKNYLHGSAQNYTDAWSQALADTAGIDVYGRDALSPRTFTPKQFRQHLGFTYNPTSRPSLDFFVNLARGLRDPSWVASITAPVRALPTMHFSENDEMPLYLKDFGPPWNYGVCVAAPAERGRIVALFSGDVLHEQQLLLHEAQYGNNSYACLFRPTAHLGDLLQVCIDPQDFSSLGPRINCSHNLSAASLEPVCAFWRGLPTIFLVAKRDIAAHEQLSWYYGDNYWNGQANPAPLTHTVY